MIKPQQFASLAVATALSVIVAAVLYSVTNRWSAGKIEGTSLIPGLTRQEKNIATVEIVQGEKKTTLQRDGDKWTVKERANYPANPERIRQLLSALAGADLIEPKTAAKDRHKQLELEDPAAKDAKSRGIRILDAKGKPLAEVVLGKSRYDAFGSGKGGVYVRQLNEAQTWLATGDPKGGVEFKDWVSTSAFETDTGKITKLTLEHPGEDPLVIEKGDAKERKFKLAKMPEGKKLKQGANIDQIVQAFGSVEMEDVRHIMATPVGDNVSVLKLESEGGVVTTFRLRKEGDIAWLSFQAAGGEGDNKKKADDITAKGAGWEFKIPQWKAEQIGKRRADLFETS